MPELPEVETVRRGLEPHLVGAKPGAVAANAADWQPGGRVSPTSGGTAGASGVGRGGPGSPPRMREATVPSMQARRPAASRSEASRYAVVVLPLVPVTPTTGMRRLG